MRCRTCGRTIREGICKDCWMAENTEKEVERYFHEKYAC